MMVKKPKKQVQQLRMLLIKDDHKADSAILQDVDHLVEFSLSVSLNFKGKLFVKPQFTSDPKWKSFLKPHIEGDLAEFENLKNKSTSAVLLVEAAERRFAFIFGYGRNLLLPSSWERDFGLKVVLNRIAPESLRSIDCRNFEELTVQTRRQVSRGSSLDRFGLNVNQDLLRQVTGEPKDSSFARRMAGSDGLMIALPIDLSGLGDKCKELLTAYNSTEYKKNYGFIDFLRHEKDPQTISELDALLIKALQSKDIDNVHLAPPEPIDWHDLDGFCYSASSDADSFTDLDIADYLSFFGDLSTLSAVTLHKNKVGVRFGTSTQPHFRWTAYQCIVFETEHKDKFYVLTCGEWYEVAKDFVTRVNKRVNEIHNDKIALPAAKTGEREGAYNQRVASSDDFILFDQKCKRVGGDPVEPCDLFTAKGQFVHVKRKTRSATLSHLFSQGTISADCFIDDETFRRDIKERLQQADTETAGIVPDERPTPADYEIVYAIITNKSKGWPLSLPFFSKLNLMNATDHLQRLGFKVALTRIDEVET